MDAVKLAQAITRMMDALEGADKSATITKGRARSSTSY